MKNIVQQWAEAKAELRAECARVGALLAEAGESIRAECGQNVDLDKLAETMLGVGWRTSHWGGMVFVRDDYVQFPRQPSAYGNSDHWSCTLAWVRQAVALFRGVTPEQVRHAAEGRLVSGG